MQLRALELPWAVRLHNSPDVIITLSAQNFQQWTEHIFKAHAAAIKHVLQQAADLQPKRDWKLAKAICIGGCIAMPAVRSALLESVGYVNDGVEAHVPL